MRQPAGISRQDVPPAAGRDGAAWTSWLAALADPGRQLRIGLCSRYRWTAWDLGRRVLDEHMLHLVSVGGHEGSVGGQALRSAAGDALWVPAGCEQILRKRAGAPVLAFANLRFSLAGAAPPPLPTVLRAPGIGGLLAQLRAEHAARQPGREERLRALLVLLFAELWRRCRHRDGGLDPAAQERVLALVERDPAARPGPADLAAAAGMSPTWFARRFRRTYGCPPRAWLVRQRIARAAERLEADPRIGAAAAAFGYADLFLFSRQFAAVMGESPRAWLRRRRMAPG